MKQLAITIVVLAVLIAWPLVFPQAYFVRIGVMTAIWTILAISLNMMIRMGQLSIAHAAFMGIGGYGSALLMMRLNVPFVLAFPASGLIVAAVAGVLGPIFLRIRGVYFVLLTFAFAQVVNLTFQAWVDLFGGNNGLIDIPKANLFGLRLANSTSFYFFALAIAVLTYLAFRAIYRSEAGKIIDSLNENEQLTKSLGVDAMKYRLAAFVVSGFFAGLSGSLYAHYIGFLSPDAFSFNVMVNALLINVIGGAYSLPGVVLASILLVPLPELLRDAKQFQMLSYGILLIVFMLFLPRGIGGVIARLKQRRTAP